MFEEEAPRAGKVLSEAPDSTSDAASAKKQAFNDVLAVWRDGSRPYERAVAAAKQQGKKTIDAPDFKRWILRSLTAFSNLYVTAAVLHCQQSAIERVLSAANDTLYGIGEFVYKVGSSVYETAKDTVKAGKDLLEVLMDVFRATKKALPYALVGGAGYFAYRTGRRLYLTTRSSGGGPTKPTISGSRRRARR